MLRSTSVVLNPSKLFVIEPALTFAATQRQKSFSFVIRLLSVHYIQTVVFPAINEHATTALPRWATYWHKSAFPFGPSFDFPV